LEVCKAPVSSPTDAEVEFIARFKPQGASAWRLHERSRFVLQDGRWWYVDGVQLA
jgi:SEC-C motif-containing protein